MRDVCAQVASGRAANMADPLKPIFSRIIEGDLRRLAETFVALQLERHKADYDIHADILSLKAQNLVQDARTAAAAWHVVRGSDNANAFLTAPLLHKHWRNE
jgi:hypothetical protein